MAPKAGLQSGPVLYRCSLGGEMKPIGAFSENQRKKVGYGIRRIDPDHSKMVCREHAPTGATSYKCEGYCHRTLPLSMFSKNTRQNGEYVCIGCREWLDSEPDPAKAAEKIRAALREEDEDWEQRAQTIKESTQKSSFDGAKTATFSDSGSVVDSMYGFLDHLLVDDEDDTVSVSNLSIATDNHAGFSTSASATATSPLVALTSAGSNASQVPAKKPRQAEAEMSSIASNSWYGGGQRCHNGKSLVDTSTGHSTPRSAAVSADRLAPHLLAKEDLNRQTLMMKKSSKSSCGTSPDNNAKQPLPPHLRSSVASTQTQLAPHEKGSFSAETGSDNSDACSEKSASTIKVQNKTAATDIPHDTAERDNLTIVPEIYRGTHLVHKDQQQWLKAQPESVVEYDSDEDWN